MSEALEDMGVKDGQLTAIDNTSGTLTILGGFDASGVPYGEPDTFKTGSLIWKDGKWADV